MHRFKTDWRLTAALMVPNLFGIVFGYYYYFDVGQFDPASTYFQPVHWWPFVADSPNAVLLMSASLLLYRFGGRRSRLLDSLAFLHMVYVGLWTTYLFLSFPDPLGSFDWGSTNNILLFSHMGMPLEALVLVPDLARDVIQAWHGATAAAWMALNWWLDYGALSLRPAPFLDTGTGFAVGSALLALFTTALWCLVALQRPATPAR